MILSYEYTFNISLLIFLKIIVQHQVSFISSICNMSRSCHATNICYPRYDLDKKKLNILKLRKLNFGLTFLNAWKNEILLSSLSKYYHQGIRNILVYDQNRFIFFILIFREIDRDVAGAAASIFIVSSIKVPNHTNELIATEMNHELPDQRINALLRFQVSIVANYIWQSLNH